MCFLFAVGNDDNDFRESLHNTLRIISEKAKDIAGDENIVSEDDIANTLANLAELNSGGESGNAGAEGAQTDLKNIMPLMSNIMENLLSKDFLYPTLSDLSTKVCFVTFCLGDTYSFLFDTSTRII